jgi:tetratricopeptide (TPR) repeat protein
VTIRGLAVVLFCLINTSCDFRSSNYYFSEALKKEDEEKYEEAIALLDKVIKKNHRNMYALMNRGVDKSMLEDYNGAIEDYSRIIEIDESNTLAYLNRGKNRARIEDYEGAVNDFDKAIKTKGGELFWIDKMENIFINNGFEFDVTMEEIRLERGFARYNLGDFPAAFDDFVFGIQHNFELSLNYYMAGLVYIKYENVDEACEMFAKAKMSGHPEAQEVIDMYCKESAEDSETEK